MPAASANSTSAGARQTRHAWSTCRRNEWRRRRFGQGSSPRPSAATRSMATRSSACSSPSRAREIVFAAAEEDELLAGLVFGGSPCASRSGRRNRPAASRRHRRRSAGKVRPQSKGSRRAPGRGEGQRASGVSRRLRLTGRTRQPGPCAEQSSRDEDALSNVSRLFRRHMQALRSRARSGCGREGVGDAKPSSMLPHSPRATS